MKTALKVLFFACLTILCLFVLEKNKQIRQYKIQEQHNLHVLDTLQLELNDLRDTIKDLLNQIDDMQDTTPEIIFQQVKATMYHPVEAQCDDSPLITADGSRICPINVIIGPEGGFSKNELGLMEEKGIIFFSLGKRRLRSETAAITSLALLNKMGDFK